MTASEQMLALVEGSKNLRRLCREYETESVTVHLKELVGGAFSLYAAATIRRTGGVHVFVAEDRDAAAYLLNDLYALLDERRILFFPSSYKRSIGKIETETAFNIGSVDNVDNDIRFAA